MTLPSAFESCTLPFLHFFKSHPIFVLSASCPLSCAFHWFASLPLFPPTLAPLLFFPTIPLSLLHLARHSMLCLRERGICSKQRWRSGTYCIQFVTFPRLESASTHYLRSRPLSEACTHPRAACLPVILSVCLSARAHARVSICLLPLCLSACLSCCSVYLSVCLPVDLSDCRCILFANLSIYLSACM